MSNALWLALTIYAGLCRAGESEIWSIMEFFRHLLLFCACDFFRCLVTWAQITACRLRQHEALSYFKRVREYRLLVVSFTKWRDKLLRAEKQVAGGRNHKWQEPSPGKACHRWRVAARGQQALHLGSVTTVKQVREDKGPYETVIINSLSHEALR